MLPVRAGSGQGEDLMNSELDDESNKPCQTSSGSRSVGTTYSTYHPYKPCSPFSELPKGVRKRLIREICHIFCNISVDMTHRGRQKLKRLI